MVRNAFIFPGQGAQQIGMGSDFAQNFSSARQIADQIDHTLKENLFDLMRNGPKETLDLTENAQPALLMASMMALAALQQETGLTVQNAHFVAGHSCGEYVALTAAGSFSLEQAARLLKLRGQAMQAAVAPGHGAMAALLGADPDLAHKSAQHGQRKGVCDIANDNCPGQIVISGQPEAVQSAMDKARELGVRKAVPLPVSAAFHSSMMESAQMVMADALKHCELKKPSIPVVTNDNATPQTEPDALRSALISQMTSMVRWRECILWLTNPEHGAVSVCVEAGHGATLTAINRRTARPLHGLRLSQTSDIASVAKALG